MDKKVFFDGIREALTLTNQNVAGFDFLLDKAEAKKVPLAEAAYALATTYHETAATMMPIREYGRGKGRKYGKPGKYGQVPYGRGYVQLTWDFNYERADKELGLKGRLLNNFDLAMDPEIASEILFTGMKQGWFTTKKFSDYIDNIEEDDKEELREFANARRIINGTDKQVMIAKYALVIAKALKLAGYLQEASQKPVESVPDVPTTQVPKKPETRSTSFSELLVRFLKFLFRRQ